MSNYFTKARIESRIQLILIQAAKGKKRNKKLDSDELREVHIELELMLREMLEHIA